MNIRLGILFLFLLSFTLAAEAATLHGTIYDSSLNLIKDVQLEINTTPKQHMVSKNGGYFFFAPIGVYEISAEKFQQGILAYTAKEVVEVSKDGEFNIDIVLDAIPGVIILPDTPEKRSLFVTLRSRYGLWFYAGAAGIAIILILAALSIYFIITKKRVSSKSEPENKIIKKKAKGIINHKKKDDKEVKEKPGLAEEANFTQVFTSHDIEHSVQIPEMASEESRDKMPELNDLLEFIKEEGSRTTQKDIRKKFPLSEAKISLMIAELESKGKVQKIKKGRGNIIVLKEISS